MKRILITGGASGLGKALAEKYAQQGFSVCIADINQADGEALASALSKQFGNDCFYHRLDVTSEDEWQTIQQSIGERWQGLDIIVNNAGVASSGDIDQLPMSDFQWTLDVNVMGVAKGCYTFVPMLKKSKGHVVNVASIAGLIHMSSMSAYNTSKAAVVAMSETLLAELAPFGVGVSVVCPAFFKTNLTESMRATHEGGIKIANKLMERSSIQAEDVARMVYQGVTSNKFYVVTHPKETWLWRIKRFIPSLYFAYMKRTAKKFHAKANQG